MSWIKNRKNKKWSKKLNWHPEDFDCENFDRKLEIAITFFQKEHGLYEDGVAGPETFRILVSTSVEKEDASRNRIMINGMWVETDFTVVWKPLPKKNSKKIKSKRTPTCIVVHHDATTSVAKCFYVLKIGGISTHFLIGNDGTIYQFVDLNNVAWHAGVSWWRPKKGKPRKKFRSHKLNKNSIGIDFCNGWYIKHNEKYVEAGLGPRKILKDSKIHGVKIGPHLDMYPKQIESYKKLISFLTEYFGIPLEVPLDEDGNFRKGWKKECMLGTFKGVQSHYHSSLNKIDTDIEMFELNQELISEKSEIIMNKGL